MALRCASTGEKATPRLGVIAKLRRSDLPVAAHRKSAEQRCGQNSEVHFQANRYFEGVRNANLSIS